MKKLLLMGMIAMSTLSITAISSVFASELKKNTAVVDNTNINADGVITNNDYIDTYKLILNEHVSDINGDWQSDNFRVPGDTEKINIYYENDKIEDAQVIIYDDSNGHKVYSFTVAGNSEKTVHPNLKYRNNYYIRVISSVSGGSVKGNLRVAVY